MAKTPCERLGAKTRILGVANLAGFLWALFSQGPAVEIDSGLLPALLPPGDPGLVIGTAGWLLALIALPVIAKLPLAPGSGAALTDSARPIDCPRLVHRHPPICGHAEADIFGTWL